MIPLYEAVIQHMSDSPFLLLLFFGARARARARARAHPRKNNLFTHERPTCAGTRGFLRAQLVTGAGGGGGETQYSRVSI